MLRGYDLRVEAPDGTEAAYSLVTDDTFGQPCIYRKSNPSVPIGTNSSNPAQAGGNYDVRDSDGDKALTHSDWSLGSGQKSLDTEESSSSKFWESQNVDVHIPGELSLLKGVYLTENSPLVGSLYRACGYFFLCEAVSHKIHYSIDGSTWSEASGNHPHDDVTGWTTDGVDVYACWEGSTTGGIVKLTKPSTVWNIDHYGSTPSTERISKVAFNGGQLFAAVRSSTVARVGMVDAATGVVASYSTTSSKTTPIILGDVITIELVSTGNAVYWITSMGDRTFVYRVTYDPDAQAMFTEQYMETPSGFICNCAIGYLSSIYLGGYYLSSYAGVGQGAVYVCGDGAAYPLFEIGEKPEDTDIPSAISNDNRVHYITEAGKDLYVATNRSIYRWDIDDGGYTDAINLNNISGYTDAPWISSISFDYTKVTPFFPSGWTEITDPLARTVYSDCVLFSGTGYSEAAIAPTGGDLITPTTGATFEMEFGEQHTGETLVRLSDGSTEARFSIGEHYVRILGHASYYLTPTKTTTGIAWYGYELQTGESWVYGAPIVAEIACSGRRKVRGIVYRGRATLYLNDDASSRVELAATVGAASSYWNLRFASGNSLVSWELDNDVWHIGDTAAVIDVGGLAYNNGLLLVLFETTTDSKNWSAITSTTYAPTGWLTSSSTSLHCGTIPKNFRSVEVSHAPLPPGSAISMTAWIDDVPYVLTAEYVSSTHTRFMLNATGFLVQTKIGLKAGYDNTSTPKVRTISVFWNFLRSKETTYVLDCRPGAFSGEWYYDSKTSIDHLFYCADYRCTFEDQFRGEFTGIITELQFLKANRSVTEGYTGVVQMTVREE